MSNLIKNPANGGNPLLENIKKAKAKANSILSFFKLEKLLIREYSRPRFIKVNHIRNALIQ
jgi:hypothetical protein